MPGEIIYTGHECRPPAETDDLQDGAIWRCDKGHYLRLCLTKNRRPRWERMSPVAIAFNPHIPHPSDTQ